MVKKSGENWENYQQNRGKIERIINKIGENRKFHIIVSIAPSKYLSFNKM